ncbi:MAG: hypothetical protein A2698_01220 [Candidatus Levybacteria bacterium RIFCSPHIGHO2_01_FULL_42_15]|nr:MAG: hypothetical protein A2698_01220 [Candidatus Levybacteria bacterium RIFCSPHIGHO2_01_FULL_42_15]
MFGAGLITFRETLEAALVVGVLVSLLTKTNQSVYKKFVWWGIGIGIGSALLLAVLLELFFGGLVGSTKQMFEGVLMFATASFLTWMILWIHRQKDMVARIKTKVVKHANEGYGLGIFFLTSSAILREGTETVLYLKATSLAGSENQMVGALVGIVAALITGYAIFVWAMKIKIQLVFQVTSIFLLLFAAGMVSHGVHEFQEVGLLPVFSFDPLINISSVLDHKSSLGSILRTLFGYTSRPTALELSAYTFYILFIFWLERFTDKLLNRRITSISS